MTASHYMEVPGEPIWLAVGQIGAAMIAAVSAWFAHRAHAETKAVSAKIVELSDEITTKLRVDRIEKKLKTIESKIDDMKQRRGCDP